MAGYMCPFWVPQGTFRRGTQLEEKFGTRGIKICTPNNSVWKICISLRYRLSSRLKKSIEEFPRQERKDVVSVINLINYQAMVVEADAHVRQTESKWQQLYKKKARKLIIMLMTRWARWSTAALHSSLPARRVLQRSDHHPPKFQTYTSDFL